MIVSADDVKGSFRGTLDFIHSRTEGLRAFDLTERGFWRSFGAIWLALPAYVVSLAFERFRLGLPQSDRALLGNLWLDLVVALGYAASFIALPLAMIWISRRLRRTDRYLSFVVVTNWIAVLNLLVLSVPTLLLVIGWATPGLALIFTAAFGIIVLRAQWFATKVTLDVSNGLAFSIVLFSVGVNIGIAGLVRNLIV